MKKIFTLIVILFINILTIASDIISSVSCSGNVFTITRADANGPCVAYYRTQNGSAVGGIHFIPVAGMLEFSDGEKTKTVTVSELVPTDMNQFYGSSLTSKNRCYMFEVWNDAAPKKSATRTMYNADKLITLGSLRSGVTYNLLSTKDVSTYTVLKTDFLDAETFETDISAWTNQFSKEVQKYYASLNQTLGYNVSMTFGTDDNEYSSDDGYAEYAGIQLYSGLARRGSIDTDMNPGLISTAGTTYAISFEANKNTSYEIPFYNRGGHISWDSGTTNDDIILEDDRVWYDDYDNESHFYSEVWGRDISVSNFGIVFPASTRTLGVTAISTKYDDDLQVWYLTDVNVTVSMNDDVAPKPIALHVNTNDSYQSGEKIYFAVEFDEIVVVSGTPMATIKIGASSSDNSYTATYVGGSYTNMLYFSVSPTIKAGYAVRNGATLTAISGEVMDLFSNTATLTTLNITNSNLKLVGVYDVTLETNGGTINGCNVTSYKYESAVKLPTAITRDGYSFGGWYEEEDFSGSVITIISASAVNKTYYAKWIPNVYSVALNTNGGSVVANNVTSYIYAVGVTLPTATDFVRSGYTFSGWYETVDFSGDAVTTIDTSTFGNKEYYAKWTANEFTITFDGQNATTQTQASIDATYAQPMTDVAVPTKIGYTFGGYYTSTNGFGTQYYTATGESTKEECDLTVATTLYAKWTANTYNIILDNEDATISGNANVLATYNEAMPSITIPTKTGYTFQGYFSEEDGEGRQYYSPTGISTGVWETASDATLYALWVPNTYNITYEVNTGSISGENVTMYTYGVGATLPTNVTKTGYEFLGWYTNSYFYGGSVSAVSASDFGNKVYWAKWSINSYAVDVNYDAAMGTVTGTDDYEYNAMVKLKATPKEDYEFVNWNGNEALNENIITFTVTKDTTVTAVFKQKEQVNAVGTLTIGTLKTVREVAPIDITALFVAEQGSEIAYTATSSQPNIVAAQIQNGKLFLTVNEFEGESVISVTATLQNGESTTISAKATVVLACNIQVESTIANVSCYGKTDGELALEIQNATEPYTIQWTGLTETNDTIANLATGNYSVAIVDAEGCEFHKTYTVAQPDEIVLSKTVQNPTCGNSNGYIEVTATGAEAFTYVWNNSATVASQYDLQADDYKVVATAVATGCADSLEITLEEPAAPVITLLSKVPTYCNENAGAIYIGVNAENVAYAWNNGARTQNLVNVPADTYTLTVTNLENNCKAEFAETIESIPLKQPEIALVTVSQETGKNLVVWLKENTNMIDYYTIYREDTDKDLYRPIAKVPYRNLSVYEDFDANPMVSSWRYKITATDMCGNETDQSEYHQTLHLQKNLGMDGNINLSWATYEGIDFSSYIILRETKKAHATEVDTIVTLSSNQTTYTDLIPAEGTSSYYVGIRLPQEINPKTQFLKAESGPFSIALSNIAEVENCDDNVAISVVADENVKIYATDRTIRVLGVKGEQITVLTVDGRVIAKTQATEIPVRLQGVYFVQVGNQTFKIVVE